MLPKGGRNTPSLSWVSSPEEQTFFENHSNATGTQKGCSSESALFPSMCTWKKKNGHSLQLLQYFHQWNTTQETKPQHHRFLVLTVMLREAELSESRIYHNTTALLTEIYNMSACPSEI